MGDTEILVEDIERLDFDQYTVYDKKMEDWRRVDKWDWNISRHKYLFICFNKIFCERYLSTYTIAFNILVHRKIFNVLI